MVEVVAVLFQSDDCGVFSTHGILVWNFSCTIGLVPSKEAGTFRSSTVELASRRQTGRLCSMATKK